MKRIPIFILTLLMLLLAGCIKSIHPLFEEKDMIFEADILGEWQEKGANNTWTFTHGSDPFEVSDSSSNYYRLVYNEEGDTAVFAMGLGKLGEHHYVDLFPMDLGVEIQNKMAEDHLVPVHSFAQVKLGKDSLEFRMFNGEWLYDMITEGRIRISHVESYNGVIITATTEELQKFVEKYGDEEKAYDDEVVLIRKERE